MLSLQAEYAPTGTAITVKAACKICSCKRKEEETHNLHWAEATTLSGGTQDNNGGDGEISRTGTATTAQTYTYTAQCADSSETGPPG